MRRVKDQDEEGKRTQGPGDQGTRGPQDQGTRGPGAKDQGNLKLFSSKFIFFSRVLDFFPGNLIFVQYHPLQINQGVGF